MSSNYKSPETVPDWDELVGNTSPSPKPSIAKPKRISTPRQDYTDLARRISEEEGFDPNITLSVMKQESGGKTAAVSPKGASGLMQLMPATAKARGVTDIFDPEQNLRAGVRELSQHYKANKGDLDRTLASYNWGSGNLQQKGLQNAPKETRDYIRNIRASLGRNTFSQPQPQSQQQPKQDTTPDWDDLVSSSETTPSSPVTRPRRVTPLQSTSKAAPPTQQLIQRKSNPKSFDWSKIRIDDTKALPQQKTIAERIASAPTIPPNTTKKLGIGDLRAMEAKEPKYVPTTPTTTKTKAGILENTKGAIAGLLDALPYLDPTNKGSLFSPMPVAPPIPRTNDFIDNAGYEVGKMIGNIGETVGASALLGPVAGTAITQAKQNLISNLQDQSNRDKEINIGELAKETVKGATKGTLFGQASKLPLVNNLIGKIAGKAGSGTTRPIAGAIARPVLTGAENVATSEIIDPNIDRAYDFVTGDNSYERNPYVTDPVSARKRDFLLGAGLGAGFQLPAALRGLKAGGLEGGARALATGEYIPEISNDNGIPMPGRIGPQLSLPPSPLDPNYAKTQAFEYPINSQSGNLQPNVKSYETMPIDKDRTIPLPPLTKDMLPVLANRLWRENAILPNTQQLTGVPSPIRTPDMYRTQEIKAPNSGYETREFSMPEKMAEQEFINNNRQRDIRQLLDDEEFPNRFIGTEKSDGSGMGDLPRVKPEFLLSRSVNPTQQIPFERRRLRSLVDPQGRIPAPKNTYRLDPGQQTQPLDLSPIPLDSPSIEELKKRGIIKEKKIINAIPKKAAQIDTGQDTAFKPGNENPTAVAFKKEESIGQQTASDFLSPIDRSKTGEVINEIDSNKPENIGSNIVKRPEIQKGKGIFDPFAYDKNKPIPTKQTPSPIAVKEAYDFFKNLENPPSKDSSILSVGPTGELHSPYFDKPVKYNPAIVDLDRLLTSHDQYFSERPGFPKAYQPRDRKLSAQAFYGEGGIIPRFNPALVAGDSISPGEGRPTIEATVDPLTGKRKVISGNKRTMAEEIIYNSFPEKAQQLKDYMLKNPPRGMSSQQVAEAIAKGKKPAAVNILKQMPEEDLIKFAKVANEPNIEDYSPLERARVDADSIDIKRLGKIGGTSDLTAAENRGFAEDFINKIATPANRGKLYKNGELTQDGVRRMQNALFVKAFGDSPETLRILSDITESTSADYKNIANALAAKAPRIAQVKALGNLDANYDISNDLMVSLNQYANLRKSNLPIDDYIKQKGVGDELTDNQKQLLKLFDETKRSPNQLKQTLDNYLDTAQKEVKTNAQQESMFGQLGQEKGEVLGQAVEQTFAARQRVKAEKAEKKAQQALIKLNKQLGLISANPFFNPDTWKAATEFSRYKAEALGRNLIAGTSEHYNAFSKDLIGRFGQSIKPYIDKLYDASTQNKEIEQPKEFNPRATAEFSTNKEKQQGLFPKGKTTTNLSPTQYQANMGINPNFSLTGRMPSQQPSLPGMTGQLSSSTPKKEQPLLKTLSSLIKANMLVNASSALGDTASTAGRLVAKNAIADTTRGKADEFLSRFGQVIEDPNNPGKFIKAGTNERTYITPSLKDVASNLGAGVKGIKGAKDIIFKTNLTPDQLAELSQHEAKTKGSDNSLVLKGIDNYVNTVGRVRAAFDEPAYQYALKDVTQAEIRVKAANGVASKAELDLAVKEIKDFQDGKIDQISSHARLRKVAEDILAKAKTDAMYETLRDDNAFSKLFSEYKNKLWEGGTAKQALGFVLDQAAPFARTGTNIIRQAGDMSVVGLYNIQKITRQARKQGGLTKDQQGSLAKSLGDVALGSIVGGIGAGLAAGGYATKNTFFNPLSGENKQERELNEAANREGGSFKLPGTDRRATSHIFGTTKPIFEFGVAAQKLLTDPEKTYTQKVSGMANQILNSALDHPASTAARDLVTSFYGPEKAQGLYRQVIKRAATLVTPKIVEQLSQAGGEKRKVTLETEGTLSQRFSKDLTNEIMNRYPWRSSFNQPEYTALGDQNMYPKSNFFDPLRSKEERITPVTTELTKQNVGLNPLQRNKETETPADFAVRSRDAGKLTNQQLGELFKSKTYADLPKIRQTQSYLKKDTQLTDRKLREEAIKSTEKLSHAGELAIPGLSYLPSVTRRIDKEIKAKLNNKQNKKFTMFLKNKE